MTSLKTSPFLILDCQTTGMRPSIGSLLEIAWGWASSESASFEIVSHLVQLPPGDTIPTRVREITGLTAGDLVSARPVDEVRQDLLSSIAAFIPATGQRPVALIHYAQFEEAWLKDLLGDELPFDILCTQRISKRLFPTVPSRNIRGLTGYFGHHVGEIKRASQHVFATHLIWTSIAPALEAVGVTTIEGALQFLSEKPTKRSSAVKMLSYEYRVDREKRLALPPQPGIYKMIAKSGDILYVGKATSLKDRVNSYFRGKKGRDPRKLELMAQVWDVEVVVCDSAVEAALVESDEIKKLNPPYNVSLKEGTRTLIYYDRTLEKESLNPSSEFSVGPFRRANAIEMMRLFANGLREGVIENAFYQEIERSVLESGFHLFEEKYPIFHCGDFSTRSHLAFGLWLLRRHVREETPSAEPLEETEVSLNADEPLTAEEVLEKIERLYLRAAQTYLRAKELTKLLWSDVSWVEKGETKRLSIRGGQLRSSDERPRAAQPLWHDLAIRDYDRMSVLLMEISKVEHQIVPIPFLDV